MQEFNLTCSKKSEYFFLTLQSFCRSYICYQNQYFSTLCRSACIEPALLNSQLQTHIVSQDKHCSNPHNCVLDPKVTHYCDIVTMHQELEYFTQYKHCIGNIEIKWDKKKNIFFISSKDLHIRCVSVGLW